MGGEREARYDSLSGTSWSPPAQFLPQPGHNRSRPQLVGRPGRRAPRGAGSRALTNDLSLRRDQFQGRATRSGLDAMLDDQHRRGDVTARRSRVGDAHGWTRTMTLAASALGSDFCDCDTEQTPRRPRKSLTPKA